MNKSKGFLSWFLICNITIVVSTFIHECAHGLSNWLAGYSVSTGFNRVGNVYMSPRDADFRTGWTGGEILKDMGPAVTLLLAIIFTIIFLRLKYRNTLLHKSILAVAFSNAIIRLIPCVIVIVRMIAFSSGMEDETQQGEAWAQYFGWSFFSYIPLIMSIAVSLLCLFLIYRKFFSIKATKNIIVNPSWVWLAYVSSFIILNILDNFIRINWVA